MLFASPLYGAFLVGTWVVFWLLGARRRVLRPLFLVVASYGFYFYGTWDAARDESVPVRPLGWAALCLAVIFVGSTLDFFIARALVRIERRAARNALLFVSVFYYLGVLAVFKYWNFAADSIASAAAALGAHVHVTRLRLILPFGISFFTFETMSYTIDVWRGELAPARRYLDYLLFVSFFPHLVAGPIVRPRQMLPQLAAEPRIDAAAQARGLWRIAVGLGKKVVIGDYLAQAIVNRAFATPERFTGFEVLLAVYAYAVQIYADFSGYSDVAIGSAALFGYVLPENFDAPYLSADLQEFWRRWHISLSTWLRDYLYKPLGGSRGSALATYRNLMITMVLGGLWHGASWNFVLWGALHGGALAVTRMWQRRRARRASVSTATEAPSEGHAIGHLVATIATFHFVCFAWIFFRAPTFAHATLAIRQMGQLAHKTGWALEHVSPRVGAVVAAAAVLHVLPRSWERRAREAFVQTPALVQGVVLAAAAIGLHFAAGAKPEPFVYGQF
ncbi:MAG TPA: MBOAT family O-acyltransferase [Polyangiaceae bacterium]|jgi:D-alanyl-lipoteichoic acid acyltransferase DltB (MBOAT superfamily)|nr:MBOAT family O-acyltransferase [Polyangiaceae bacterium]